MSFDTLVCLVVLCFMAAQKNVNVNYLVPSTESLSAQTSGQIANLSTYNGLVNLNNFFWKKILLFCQFDVENPDTYDRFFPQNSHVYQVWLYFQAKTSQCVMGYCGKL